MENLSKALYMAFAMMTFIIAFSVSLNLINKLNSTTKTIVYKLDGSYYDSFELGKIIGEDNDEKNRSRIVGVDSIIPTLYRYYKESFAVKILDTDGTLLQHFDTTTEGDVNSAKTRVDSGYGIGSNDIKQKNKDKALLKIYDDSDPDSSCNLFGAPWLANIDRDAKARIDMYISGGKGYINNVLVDYSNNNLKIYENRKFKETFTQYAYEGDTVSIKDENTEEIVSLTGNKQIATKIIIIYQLLDD